MKKSLIALTVVAALAVAGSAFARGGMMMGGQGMGPGMMGQQYAQGPYAEQYKKFTAETLPIREEMHKKHIELQKEYIKDKPDSAKISKLQADVLQLRQKMYDARVKSGLPMGKMGGKGMKGGMMGGKGMVMGPMMAPPAAPAK